MKIAKRLSAHVLIALMTGVILAGSSVSSIAQNSYEMTISNMSFDKVHKNWLLLPTHVDLKVEWLLSDRQAQSRAGAEAYLKPEDLPLWYRVVLFTEAQQSGVATRDVRNAGTVIFPRLPVGSELFVKVQAFDEHNMKVAESNTATIVIGKGDGAYGAQALGKDWLYYLHPGRWQLASLGKAEVYDHSTALGRIAFVFLSVTGFLSFIILIFYSSRTLYLGNVFPFKRSKADLVWSFSLSCDKSYEKRLTNKFKFVLKAWEMIASRSRHVADRAVKSIPTQLSSTEKMASVDVACMEYWTSDGDKAISTIGDILAFPQNHQPEASPDAMLTDLVVKIEDSFHDLIYDENSNGVNGDAGGRVNGNGNGMPHHLRFEKENMEELINEIYEPVEMDERLLARLRKWVLRKGVFDLRKGLEPFPTSKIIRAGLEIHRMNGYRWLKPTEEVKRAFEDRASTEIESLRRKSKIDWFWNYGALAPLVGLFGTVTGITYAFQQLSKANVNPDFVNTIQMLSHGIFEALWTTIFGLANGIVFVVIYYYYKHKLDWIYAKWEEIYVHITEKL